MLLTIHHKARARISASGSKVFPLEIFGLLLGVPGSSDDGAYAVAALPVGKTKRWHQPDGRFESTAEAAIVADNLFVSWGLQPIGLFISGWDGVEEDTLDLVGTAPHISGLPWLVIQPSFGGERIWGPSTFRDTRAGWQAAKQKVDRRAVLDPRRNSKRIAAAWNRAWGTLNYDNGYRAELARQQVEGSDR